MNSIPTVKAERREIHATKTIDDLQIVRSIDGRSSFQYIPRSWLDLWLLVCSTTLASGEEASKISVNFGFPGLQYRPNFPWVICGSQLVLSHRRGSQ